ncbi:methyltransferase [Streptosporangium sp. CA-115845]|uniref:methyltransferase n=1 Tax=Streptosporangium sp. CA-115845 TaxID=3240071 RepID=UPI003D8AE270
MTETSLQCLEVVPQRPTPPVVRPYHRLIVERRLRDLMHLLVLATFVELEIADHLADGPLDVQALARRCQAQPDELERFLPVAAADGLLRRDRMSRYQLTHLGQAMRADIAESLRPLVRACTDEPIAAALLRLPATIRAGSAAAFPAGPLTGRPAAAALVRESGTADREAQIVEALSGLDLGLAHARSLVVVGTDPRLVAALVKAHPHCRGIVFRAPEQEGTAAGAAGCEADRQCTIVYGIITQHLLPPADIYLLIGQLREMDDSSAQQVLSAVREAMNSTSSRCELWVVEGVLDAAPHPQHPWSGSWVCRQVYHLALGAGRIRTHQQYHDLFESARLEQVKSSRALTADDHLFTLRCSR